MNSSEKITRDHVNINSGSNFKSLLNTWVSYFDCDMELTLFLDCIL